MFNNRRKNNETPAPVEGDNDEEMPFVSSDISNFESFPREFGNYVYLIEYF